LILLDPLPPSDAVRKQKKMFWRIFSVQYCQNLKEKYHPSGNLKFNNLGTFQSFKLRNFMGKIPQISLKLNVTPNTLGCWVKSTMLVFCKYLFLQLYKKMRLSLLR